MHPFKIVVLLALLAGSELRALDITGDISANDTWDASDSPVSLKPSFGNNIAILSGATVTIDASSGPVVIIWIGDIGWTDFDLIVGDGGSGAGHIVISASSYQVTFDARPGCNILINTNGSINFSDASQTTTFTSISYTDPMTLETRPGNEWGALVFIVGQTFQSELKNCSFAWGGYDSVDGALWVQSNDTSVPKLENLAFDFCNTSAIRMDGTGINVLRQGNLKPPLSVSNTTYVLLLNSVISTAEKIVFPDPTTPDSPDYKLIGTNQVGDTGEQSEWVFLDGCTFKCVTSSSLQVVNGGIHGSSEAVPTFESIEISPTYTDWVGLADYSTTNKNTYGDLGTFAYVTVRNAAVAFDLDKGTSYVPDSGQKTLWRFPGLTAKKCDIGIRVRTYIDTGSGNAGYTTQIEGADLGDSSSTDDCNAACFTLEYGRAILDNCRLKGSVTDAVLTGTVSENLAGDLTIRNSRISDVATSTDSTAINCGSCRGAFEILLDHTIIEGYRRGIAFFQTSTGSYTPARALTARHCFITADASGSNISASGVDVQVLTNATCTVLIEDCTISGVTKTGTGTSRGIHCEELRSGSSLTVRRTIIGSNTDYGVDVASATNNTCQYTFDECSITGNGDGGTDEGGIRDRRTQSAKVAATHCTFAGNNPRGATDNDATQQLLAENCFWNASDGPSGSGPGSGDAISSNVDASPFLDSPYIGWLIGGSPAGVSALGVNNAAAAATYADQLHVIDDDAVAVKWAFASDFNGATQTSYEIDIDNDLDFGSLTYNGSKTGSASVDIAIAPTLAAGTLYYLRVRLWDANDRAGPWYYHTFRTNSVPPQVGNTNRSPADDFGVGGAADYTDATPPFIWERPVDADEDPLHFELNIDDDAGFGSITVALSSVTTPSAFQISTDSGITWVPFPSVGAQAGATIRIRCTLPAASALSDGTWNWRVRATDGFENGSWATTWDFVLTRSYTLAGTLVDTSGTGVGSATIIAMKNGSSIGSTSTSPGGTFTITSTSALVAGDSLVIFRDGGSSTTRSARLVQFSGENMTGLNLRYKRAYIQQTQSDPINMGDFSSDSSNDSDIPWTNSPGALTFSADLAGAGEGVNLLGQWDLGAGVDCTTNDVEFTVNTSGYLRTLSYTVGVHKLDNDGTLDVSSGSIFTIDNSSSTSSGTMRVYSATLRLKKSGGLTFTVDRGTAEFRNATLDVDGSDVSTLEINTASAVAGYAVLDCTGTTFSKIKLVVETDGLVAAFNENVFSTGVSTRHIHWKAEDPRTTTTFRGTQFNYSLGGGEFNVEASSGALVLNMVRSGGPRYGEGYDKNGGSESDSLDNKVLWTLMPPLNVATTLGDTRVRVTWTADDQGDLTNAGYNVYRATSEGGSYSKINVALVTDAFYNDDNAGGGLSNGTTYWYYVTCIDTNPAPDTESGGSVRVSATPAAGTISLLTPGSANSTSILAMTVIGTKTHWDGGATLTITKGGGSGLTVNDTIVLSATLMLTDATLSSATTGTWTVTAARDNVWSIGAYDESDTENLTVSANSNDNRPTISFTNPSADANTSGGFTIGLSYSANSGDSIDTATLELYASRDVTVQSSNRVVGTNLAQIGSFWDTLNSTTATCNVGQTSGSELFADGEYTLSARIGNTTSKYSEWISRRFYVEGAGTNVVKCTTLLLQGSTMNATVTGTSLSSSGAISFGSDITVNSASGSGSSITVNVTVGQLATCGPRTITTNAGAKSGIGVVEYPTNLYPTTTNSEPSRNPAIGGLNVFLMNGAFFKSETDIATRGLMMGISWSRFYRSDITYNGPLGNGWVVHYFQRCVYDSGSGDIWWYTPDGRKETFPDVTGGFTAPVGVYVGATRETTHNTITLTDRHGYQCVFDSNGRLWRCIDRNRNFVECSYNYAGQLTRVTDDRAMYYDIAYQTNGRVDTVTDKVYSTGSPRVVEYEYDSNGDLTEQKAPTTSRYDGSPQARVSYVYRYQSHRLTECVNPNEAAQGGYASYMENQYEYDSGNSRWRVVAQRLGGQDQWLYIRYMSSTTMRVVDRRGLRTDYTIDASGRATNVLRYTKTWSVDCDEAITHSTVTQVNDKVRAGDPDYFETVFTYNTNHEVLTVTYPRGNKATYTYALSAASQTSGTATSCSANVLSKTSAGWTPSAYVGMTLRMGTNAGNYRYYAITANGADTITVDATFSLSGDGWGASAYAVYNLNADPLAAGNVLSVTRSDEGLGSESDIVTTYTYEPRYQFVRTVTNPRSKTTTYTYDYEDSSTAIDAGHGNLVKVAYHSVTSGQPGAQNIVVYMTYDQYGRPVTSVDGEGNVTLNTYYTSSDHTGFLYQRVSAYGSLDLTTEFDYNRAGVMTAQWPPRAFDSGVTKDDYKTEYTVNELDQVVKVSGRKLISGQNDRKDVYYYYDASGNVTNTFVEYLTAGGSEPSDPADFTTTSGFTKPSSTMAAGWTESSAVYDLLNRVTTSTVDAVAGSTVEQYTSYNYYDANDNVVSTVSAQGLQSKRVLDERDMVYQSIAGANSDAMGTFTSNYDANGNIATSVDARAYTTTYTYDGFDRTTTVTDTAGHYRTSTYDANSNVLYSRAYDSAATLLAESLRYYDEIDRVYKTEITAKDYNGTNIGDGLGTATTLFDKNSRVTSSTDDNGVTFYRFYDAASRVSSSRDAVGNETANTYNSDGAVTKTTFYEINGLTNAVEKSHVEYDLDKLNRKLAFRDQRYTVSTFDTQVDYLYDSANQLVTFTDAGGIETDYVYDLLGRNTRVTRKPDASDATWTITDTVYDKASRATRRTIYETPDDTAPSDPQHTDYVYNERSQRIVTRRADGDVYTYRYDANGNLNHWEDPEGNIVDQTFDSRNLVNFRNITKGDKTMGATSEAYNFDALRRLKSCSNYDGDRLMVADQWEYNTLSLAERLDQTVCMVRGTMLPTHTTKAEYDAAGHLTADVFFNGRRVEYDRDSLNRLAVSYDVTNGQLLNEIVYSGSRVIQRTSGNNTQMSYDYEQSGCGCGGFSALVERVECSRLSDGEVLFAEDRRYNVKGNMTARRKEHEGNLGEVYRYDDANRLTTSYIGADCSSTNLASYVSSSVPTTFSVKRTYALDSRGNRSGSTGMKEVSDEMSPTYSRDFSYTVYDAAVGVDGGNMNTYSAVDGDSYAYDKQERMKQDGDTGDYLGWDYRDLLVGKDDDAPSSPLPSPWMINTHDCLGRLCLTEFAVDNGGGVDWCGWERFDFKPCEACNSCSAPGSPQPMSGETGGGSPTDGVTTTLWDTLPGIPVPRSGSAVNPLLVTPGPTGDTSGPEIADEVIYTPVGSTLFRFHARNQLGSLMCVTDSDGEPVDEYEYGENGEVFRRPVAFYGAKAAISSVAHNTPSSDQSTITMTSALFSADQYNGAQIVVSLPTDSNDRLRVGIVLDTTTTTLIISDAGTYDIAAGIYNGIAIYNDFVLFDFNDKTITNAPSGYQLGGAWSGVSHSAGTTTLTDSGGNFQPWLIGCFVCPNVEFPSYFEITGTTSSTLSVAGNLTTIAASGNFYRVHIPPGADKTTGTLATINTFETDIDWDVVGRGSVYLWAQYRYQITMLGFTDATGGPPLTIGGQGGTNKRGQYYCLNRNYDIKQGRWISPDQASSPFYDLFDYAGSRHTQLSDPTGLKIALDTNSTEKDFIIRLLKRLCPDIDLSWKRGAAINGTSTDELVANPTDFCNAWLPGRTSMCTVSGPPRRYGCQILCNLINSGDTYWLWPLNSQEGAFNPNQWGTGLHQIKFNGKEQQPHTLDFHGANGATVKWSIARQLAHELSHAWQYEKGVHFLSPEKRGCAVEGPNDDEANAVGIENILAKEIVANDARMFHGSLMKWVAGNHRGPMPVPPMTPDWGGPESGGARVDTGNGATRGNPTNDKPEGFPWDGPIK